MSHTGRTQLSLPMFAASPDERARDGKPTSVSLGLMSSWEAFPVRISQVPGNVRVFEKAHALVCGGNSFGSLASYDPELWCWKMSPGLPIRILRKWGYFDRLMHSWLLVRCPPSAMMHAGKLYLLPMPEPHTLENAGSAWPTLQADDVAVRHLPEDENIYVTQSGTLKYLNPTGQSHIRLSQTVQYYEDKDDWYTLTANDGLKEGAIELKRENGLSAQVRWATLKATGNQSVNSQDKHVALEKQVLWQTPQANDFKNTAGASRFDRQTVDLNAQVAGAVGDKLNPDWCEQLMGFPLSWTDPQSPAPEVSVESVLNHAWPAPPGPQLPHEVVRTTARTQHRAKRIKALGNAVVPQCVLPIALEIRAWLEKQDATQTLETP